MGLIFLAIIGLPPLAIAIGVPIEVLRKTTRS